MDDDLIELPFCCLRCGNNDLLRVYYIHLERIYAISQTAMKCFKCGEIMIEDSCNGPAINIFDSVIKVNNCPNDFTIENIKKVKRSLWQLVRRRRAKLFVECLLCNERHYCWVSKEPSVIVSILMHFVR